MTRLRGRLRTITQAIWGQLGSVRVRLTLWYLLILTVVFVVFGALLLAQAEQRATIEEDNSLITSAQQVSATYSARDGQLHLDNLLPPAGVLINANVKHTSVTRKAGFLSSQDIIVLISPQGAIVQQIGPLTNDALADLEKYIVDGSMSRDGGVANGFQPLTIPVRLGQTTAQESYTFYGMSITNQGQRVATLLLGRVNGFNQALQTVAPGLLLAGPLTLLIAAIGGYWLASRAMRPIRKITRTAQALSASDLSQRINLQRQDELGELATTFDGMLDRLEAAFTRQRQFTADASHELRTPLTIVDLEVTHALAAPRSPAEYARALTIVQAENATMARLVNDLLLLARADAATEALQPQRLDLSEVALETVERMAPLARRSGVALATDALPDVLLFADRSHLARALANLIENAIIYTAGVGSRVTVTTGATDRDGRLWGWARIADDGPGIPAANLPHLFDRFYRVDTARVRREASAAESLAYLAPAESDHARVSVPSAAEQPTPTLIALEPTCDVEQQTTGDWGANAAERIEIGGSGLGLAIVQWVAQAHGGEARVESTVGVGSTFELWLPLAAVVE